MAPSVNIEVPDLPPELRAEAATHAAQSWVTALEREAETLFNRGEMAIIGELTRQFEKALILRALAHTGGRRIEASHLLGLGRNTLTRKIQELKLDAGKQ
jgi:two-component system nitrogen regulation response regulator GlnG